MLVMGGAEVAKTSAGHSVTRIKSIVRKSDVLVFIKNPILLRPSPLGDVDPRLAAPAPYFDPNRVKSLSIKKESQLCNVLGNQ
jgi:hypothetical protein